MRAPHLNVEYLDIHLELDCTIQGIGTGKNTHGKHMTTLIAKPVVNGQYWVVTDGAKKVGNVIADSAGYEVKLNGTNTHYASTSAIKRKAKIAFQTLKTNKTSIVLPFSHYPTTKRIYNSIVDVKRKLHIFTKTVKSKCFYAAGWFVLDQDGEKEVMFCPKYIFIERYQYSGPYKTKTEAEKALNSL